MGNKIDPYEVLGVDRGASKEEIRKAYREKAKAFHPDAGGDAAEFAKATTAYEILDNDEARARWERTGETGRSREESSVMNTLQMTLQSVVDAKNMQQITLVNIIDEMKILIKGGQENVMLTIRKMKSDESKFNEAAGRLSVKQGDDFLCQLLKEKARACGSNAQRLEGELKIGDMAIKELERYQYKTDDTTQNGFRTVMHLLDQRTLDEIFGGGTGT